jgi:hypothetical protein
MDIFYNLSDNRRTGTVLWYQQANCIKQAIKTNWYIQLCNTADLHRRTVNIPAYAGPLNICCSRKGESEKKKVCRLNARLVLDYNIFFFDFQL